MSIGLGIFLAGLSVGIALLLINPVTRRMIKKTILWVIAGLVIATISYYFYSKHVEEAKSQLEANPSMAGIKLGDPRIDVIYKLGEPSSKSESGEYFVNGHIGVSFKDRIVNSAVIDCKNAVSRHSLNGIACGDPLSKIQNRFKDKVTELCHIGVPTERIYIASKYNSMYVLEKGIVTILVLRDGNAPEKLSWISCNAAQYFD